MPKVYLKIDLLETLACVKLHSSSSCFKVSTTQHRITLFVLHVAVSAVYHIGEDSVNTALNTVDEWKPSENAGCICMSQCAFKHTW